MPRQPIDYSKTIIYKIVCNDLNVTETYVGHTTNFIKRKCGHKSNCNNEKSKNHNFKVYKIIRDNGGWDNWTMIQICEYPCNSLQEATAEERRQYELLNAILNTVIPGRTKQQYYEENKDILLEKMKIYYEENRDKKIEYAKKYCGENKDIISEKGKIYRDKNKKNKMEYDKIYREVNKNKKKEQDKKWYEKNKEKILERIKQKYTCCCGSLINISGKLTHEKSIKHQKYFKSLESLDICVSL